MTGRFVNSILARFHGRDCVRNFRNKRRYVAEEPRCGMQKHAGAVNLFTKRFLIETLCANPPASPVSEVSFPAVRIVGTKFLNAARNRAEI